MIPQVNISPYLDKNSTLADRIIAIKEWGAAFKSVGFASVVGHDVDSELIGRLYDHSLEFFQKPDDFKMQYYHNSSYGSPGYTPLGKEAVARTLLDDTAVPDSVESLVYHSGNDALVPINLKSDIVLYCAQMNQLLKEIMQLSAEALGLDKNYFEPYFTLPENALRLAYYPSDSNTGGMRYGAHTDYTGFTILRQDDYPGGGLEVMVNEKWVQVPYQKDAFVINAGDLIQRWTNDIFKSNLHRVAPSKSENIIKKGRLSIVFFTGPNADSIISTIENCCSSDNPSRYEPIVASEHLQSKLKLTNVSNFS